jgi:hypothetical protein
VTERSGDKSSRQIALDAMGRFAAPGLKPEPWHELYFALARIATKAEQRPSTLPIPEGMKLVPIKPTPSMLERCGPMTGYDPESETPDRDHCDWYTAMVEAAPTLSYAESAPSPQVTPMPSVLLGQLITWTRQVGEQPIERAAKGIASAARGFHKDLSALSHIEQKATRSPYDANGLKEFPGE